MMAFENMLVEEAKSNFGYECKCRGPPPTFPSSNASCDASPNIMMLSRGLASRYANSEYTPLESNQFREAILGSGHTFKNADEFRNAIYQMSLAKRLREINPGTIAEYTSHEGHFKQLFIAHAFSIQGFTMGCRLVLAIDSCHLSGPYKGALLSAIAYDADDGMFPLALDRHKGILRSVSELFGVENHAYCYRHVKENFSSFFNRQNIRGKKRKEDALLLLDNIAYARLDIDYNEAFEKLVHFNADLARWVAENSPEHWAMSKFLKKRWDKMTTNIAEFFNAWLREERHQTIYTLLLMHMDKLVAMLDTHMRGKDKWKSVVGPIIEEKLICGDRQKPCHLEGGMRVEEWIKRGVVVGMVMGMGLMLMDILQVTSTSSEHPFGTIRACEEKLLNLPIGEEFRRAFIFYASQRSPTVERTMEAKTNVDHDTNVDVENSDQQLRIMRGLMHKLGARRHSGVNSDAGGHSGYAPANTPTADDHAFPGDEDMASHAADHVIDTPDRVVAPEFELQPSVPINAVSDGEEQPEGNVVPTNRKIRRRRVRQMAPNLLSPYISQPQTKQSAIRMNLKQAAALVFGEDLDASCLHFYDLRNQVVDAYCRLLRHNCGVFVMKFMELWSMGEFSKSIDAGELNIIRMNFQNCIEIKTLVLYHLSTYETVVVTLTGRDLMSGTILRGCMHLIDLADRGQAKTLMFVHISPEPDAVRETISTVKFAERFATVELGAARVNKDSADVKELKEQARSNSMMRQKNQSFDLEELLGNSPPWPPISSAVQNYVEDDKDIGSDSSKLFPDQSYNIFMANNRYDIANNDDLHEDAATGASSDVDLLWQFNNAKITSMTNGIVSKIKKPNTKPANSPKLSHYHSKIKLKDEDIKIGKDKAMGMYKVVEEYLHANLDAYA
uniref:Kinesin motor domain-containing protein n=1 Tax=Vitis vinifera TaxID=29760 RepID=A5AV56_VITVI|nr:hypothetical protein VITISV_036329 [Vitis vinifera]